MAIQTPGFLFTLEAGADLSANKFKLAAVDTNGQAVLPADATTVCVGVFQTEDADAVGKAVTIMGNGITKVEAGGTITAGQECMASAALGTVITGTGAGNLIVGVSLTAAVIGEFFPMLITLNGPL